MMMEMFPTTYRNFYQKDFKEKLMQQNREIEAIKEMSRTLKDFERPSNKTDFWNAE
jgi:hypothetical protein